MGGRDSATICGTFGKGARHRQNPPASVDSIYRICQALHIVAENFNSKKMGLDLRFFLREEEGDETPFDFDCADEIYVQEHLDRNGECGWALYRQAGKDLHLILNIYLFLDADDKEATVSLGLGFPEDQDQSSIQEIVCSSRNGAIPHKKLAEAVGDGICTAIIGSEATALIAMLRQKLVDEFYRVYAKCLGLKTNPDECQYPKTSASPTGINM